MVTINIIQPALGRLVVISSTESSYTVSYIPPQDQQYTRGNIKLYCEACGETLIESGSNPAVFDITHLEEMGHPGPFDISVDVRGIVTAYIWTSVAAGSGKTFPQYAEIGTTIGGDVVVELNAIPDEGYEFDHWSSSESTWTSTVAHINLHITGIQSDTYRRYYAHFRPKQSPKYKIVIHPQIIKSPWNTNSRIDTSPGTVALYDLNVFKYNIATTTGGGMTLAPGESATVSVEMLQTRQNERFVSWNFGNQASTGASFTITAPSEQPSVETELDVYLNFSTGSQLLLEIGLKNSRYGYFTYRYGYASNAILVESTPSTYPNGVVPSPNPGYSRVKIELDRQSDFSDPLSIDVRLWRNAAIPAAFETLASKLALVHGISIVNVVQSSVVIVNHDTYVHIEIPQPFQVSTDLSIVSIAACTHSLIYGDQDNLLSNPPQLLFECNKSSTGTFIEIT